MLHSTEAVKNASGIYKDAHNERAQRQEEIEKRLVGQLGDRYKDAQLLEVSEGSYLIRNHIKLPLFGSSIKLLQRTKATTSTHYLKNKKLGLFNAADLSKYVLDMSSSSQQPQQAATNELKAQQQAQSKPAKAAVQMTRSDANHDFGESESDLLQQAQ